MSHHEMIILWLQTCVTLTLSIRKKASIFLKIQAFYQKGKVKQSKIKQKNKNIVFLECSLVL